MARAKRKRMQNGSDTCMIKNYPSDLTMEMQPDSHLKANCPEMSLTTPEIWDARIPHPLEKRSAGASSDSGGGAHTQKMPQNEKRERCEADSDSDDLESATLGDLVYRFSSQPTSSSSRRQLLRKPVVAENEELRGDKSKDQWIQCDACDKWRLVPNSFCYLPQSKEWYCSMNITDPDRSSCDAAELKYIAPAAQRKQQRRRKQKAPTTSGHSSDDNAGDDDSSYRQQLYVGSTNTSCEDPAAYMRELKRLVGDPRSLSLHVDFLPVNPRKRQPSKLKMPRWQRYELYKGAATLREAKALGATDDDLVENLDSNTALLIEDVLHDPLLVKPDTIKAKYLAVDSIGSSYDIAAAAKIDVGMPVPPSSSSTPPAPSSSSSSAFVSSSSCSHIYSSTQSGFLHNSRAEFPGCRGGNTGVQDSFMLGMHGLSLSTTTQPVPPFVEPVLFSNNPLSSDGSLPPLLSANRMAMASSAAELADSSKNMETKHQPISELEQRRCPRLRDQVGSEKNSVGIGNANDSNNGSDSEGSSKTSSICLSAASRQSILSACARFRGLDSNKWFLKKDVVRSELQQTYCRDNLDKHGAHPFRLSTKATSLLTQGAEEIKRDWNTYLRQSHPGFSSYGATVGEHDDNEQEKHTRVVGPSPQHWEAFESRYKSWFNEVRSEVEMLMSLEVAKHYTAEKAQRKAERRAKRAQQRNGGCIEGSLSSAGIPTPNPLAAAPCLRLANVSPAGKHLKKNKKQANSGVESSGVGPGKEGVEEERDCSKARKRNRSSLRGKQEIQSDGDDYDGDTDQIDSKNQKKYNTRKMHRGCRTNRGHGEHSDTSSSPSKVLDRDERLRLRQEKKAENGDNDDSDGGGCQGKKVSNCEAQEQTHDEEEDKNGVEKKVCEKEESELSSEESEMDSEEAAAVATFEDEAEAEALLPCQLHDMHLLRQVSSASLGGAVFDDHQDRHGEVQHNTPFRWTVTLLAHSTGPPTGFFMWNARTRPGEEAFVPESQPVPRAPASPHLVTRSSMASSLPSSFAVIHSESIPRSSEHENTKDSNVSASAADEDDTLTIATDTAAESAIANDSFTATATTVTTATAAPATTNTHTASATNSCTNSCTTATDTVTDTTHATDYAITNATDTATTAIDGALNQLVARSPQNQCPLTDRAVSANSDAATCIALSLNVNLSARQSEIPSRQFETVTETDLSANRTEVKPKEADDSLIVNVSLGSPLGITMQDHDLLVLKVRRYETGDEEVRSCGSVSTHQGEHLWTSGIRGKGLFRLVCVGPGNASAGEMNAAVADMMKVWSTSTTTTTLPHVGVQNVKEVIKHLIDRRTNSEIMATLVFRRVVTAETGIINHVHQTEVEEKNQPEIVQATADDRAEVVRPKNEHGGRIESCGTRAETVLTSVSVETDKKVAEIIGTQEEAVAPMVSSLSVTSLAVAVAKAAAPLTFSTSSSSSLSGVALGVKKAEDEDEEEAEAEETVPATALESLFPFECVNREELSSLKGVIPYQGPGSAVVFPSLAWHRTVIPAQAHWPFEALKFSFFFAEPTERERRYHLKQRAAKQKDTRETQARVMAKVANNTDEKEKNKRATSEKKSGKCCRKKEGLLQNRAGER